MYTFLKNKMTALTVCLIVVSFMLVTNHTPTTIAQATATPVAQNFLPIVEVAFENTPVPTEPPSPTPTATASPTPRPIQENLCMNYGHQTNQYDLSPGGEIDRDLKNLLDAGIVCVRLAYEDWNYNRMLELAAFAKSKGFRIILGGHYGEVSENDLEAYTAAVIQQAAWAEAHGIDQFSLGNEQESKMTINLQQWYTFLMALSTQVRQVYSGVISYETSGEFDTFWLNKSLGSIDRIGFNMYSGYETNRSRLQAFIDKHGEDSVYLAESNADMDTGNYGNDTAHAEEVLGNTMRLREALDIPVYYFTYATCNNGVPNHWGLYQCGILAQPQTAAVLGID